jgi:hypothetical protein
MMIDPPPKTPLRMTRTLYYKTPSQDVFNDVKQAAMQIWSKYDDTYGYRTEKINRIKDIKNIKDNYAYIIAMFDHYNQLDLLNCLKTDEAKELVEALLFRNDTAKR